MIASEKSVIWIQKTIWKTYKNCPLMMKYLFIENMPPNTSIKMLFGNIFHKFAEGFFKRIDKERLLTLKTFDETFNYFKSFNNIEQQIVKVWVENFLRFEAQRWISCLTQFPNDPYKFWAPIATELEIYVNETAQLLHVDRLSWYDETSIIVIDYKTGRTWDERDLKQELTFYSIGLNAHNTFGAPIIWLGCYNPHLDKVLLVRANQRTTNSVAKSIKQMREDIRNNILPAKPSGLCRFCPRLQSCITDGVFDDKEGENNEREISCDKEESTDV
jgi:hypothetical protein